MIIIAAAIGSVPTMTNRLVELMSLQSIYQRISYHPKGDSTKHVVICGDLRTIALKEFLSELFHADNISGDHNFTLSAVILQSSERANCVTIDHHFH